VIKKKYFLNPAVVDILTRVSETKAAQLAVLAIHWFAFAVTGISIDLDISNILRRLTPDSAGYDDAAPFKMSYSKKRSAVSSRPFVI
jgi:hypothetical protein